MRNYAWLRTLAVVLTIVAASHSAFAAIEPSGALDQVADRFLAAASTWGATITRYASNLFWSLVLISMVWTFGMLALRKADISDFFGELVRFTVTTGLFWWLLSNGPRIALAIINSLRDIGAAASGLNRALTPSTPIDIAFDIIVKSAKAYGVLHPIDNLFISLVTLAILASMCVVGANLLMALVNAWVACYAGIFVLGFGGSRWTSDIAVNYFRSVLGIGLKLMTMTLLIGVATSIMDQFYAQLSAGAPLRELLVIFVVALVLALMIHSVPNYIAGLVPGGGAAAGAGSFSGAAMAGAALTAANAATAAASAASTAVRAAGGMAASTGANALGAGSALKAAIQKAQSSIGESSSGGAMPRSQGSSDSWSSKSKGTGTAGDSPFAQAAGFGSVGQSSGGMPSTTKPLAGTGSPGGFNLPIGDAVSAGTPAGGAKASGGASSSSATGSSSSSASSATGSAGGAGASAGAGSSGGVGLSSGTESSAGGGSLSSPDGKAQGRGRLATAGAIAAGTGAALAQGIADVAADRIGALKEAARERIGETLGGKVAAAIERSGGNAEGKSGGAEAENPSTPDPSPTFGGNSLAGADDSASASSSTAGAAVSTGGQRAFTDEQLAEIAAFVNKGQPLSEA